ncbi:hypothetical protein WHR41_08700 [Cladosporium halotolerans]|uniref:Catechol dioxygenase n=1 Tax=Cladosporium halotolerans TaxID=1052096 RepID=A0AB34KCG8_9PEZI
MGSQGDTGLLGKEFTQSVVDAMGPKTPARFREIMSSLIRHLHEFALETQLTTDEWMMGVNAINWAGQMSDDKLDDITFSAATRSSSGLTSSAILGPFWRNDHPVRQNGTTISFDTPKDAEVAFMHGKVTDVKTGKPIVGATIDIWQASTNGLYEQQDPNQRDLNLRGKYVTDDEGRYSLYCLRPTPYPVPDDGPAGQLLKLMDRHPFRPAHIHLVVGYKGYKHLTTQIFDKGCKYLADDSVFAVKDELCVTFLPRKDDPEAKLDLEYDIALAPSA